LNVKKMMKRVAAPLAAVGAAGGLVMGLSATPAAASTIPDGHIQLCAQGNYSAYIHILSEPVGGGETTQTLESTIVPAGQCWWTGFNTLGRSVQVDVVGIYNVSHQEFYIGSEWWNSSTGLGIGAEGKSTSPWIQTW
jgi:hypothetical protein